MFLVILSIVAFFLLITGLIIIHEIGHYLAARKLGVEVEEFGFGLPPRVSTLFTYQGTKFTLNAIPVGGFVRLKGENSIEVGLHAAEGSFARASIFTRCIILLAGVTMNLLVALVVYFYGFSIGQWVPTYLSVNDMQDAARRGEITLELGVVVSEVLEGGGAQAASIPVGSLLLKVDGESVALPEDVIKLQQGTSQVIYTLQRTPGSEDPESIPVTVNDGKTGVVLRVVPKVLEAPTRGILAAGRLSLREIRVVTAETVLGILHLISSLAQRFVVPEEVTGLIGIAQLTYSSVVQGASMYLRLLAVISLNLAVLNVLPFPALDGGRLVFVSSEFIVRPGSRKVELIVNALGFTFLLLLIVLVTVYDVVRIIGR